MLKSGPHFPLPTALSNSSKRVQKQLDHTLDDPLMLTEQQQQANERLISNLNACEGRGNRHSSCIHTPDDVDSPVSHKQHRPSFYTNRYNRFMWPVDSHTEAQTMCLSLASSANSTVQVKAKHNKVSTQNSTLYLGKHSETYAASAIVKTRGRRGAERKKAHACTEGID
jgi:hypothetical protein